MLVMLGGWSLMPLAAQDGRGAVEVWRDAAGYRRQVLADAGYREGEPSLIAALNDASALVRSAAVFALWAGPPSSAGVNALKQMMKDTDVSVAVTAGRALVALKATGWESDAAARMEAASAGVEVIGRLELAGVLAAAGRSDGWTYVREALQSRLADVAASQIAFFDGLKDEKGWRIDASLILVALSQRHFSTDPDDIALRNRLALELEAFRKRAAAER